MFLYQIWKEECLWLDEPIDMLLFILKAIVVLLVDIIISPIELIAYIIFKIKERREFKKELKKKCK